MGNAFPRQFFRTLRTSRENDSFSSSFCNFYRYFHLFFDLNYLSYIEFPLLQRCPSAGSRLQGMGFQFVGTTDIAECMGRVGRTSEACSTLWDG